MSVTEYTTDSKADDDNVLEISLTDISSFLKKNCRFLFISAVLGALLGALYAFSKENEFTSQVTVMPEIQSKSTGSLGGLGSLAGLAGVDVSGLTATSDAIRPDLYPNVLQSAPFALSLLEQPVYAEGINRPIKLTDYLKQQSGKSFFRKMISLYSVEQPEAVSHTAKVNDVLQLNRNQEEAVKAITAQIVTNYDKKTGIIQITSTMPDPLIAATVTQQSLLYLTEYVTSYRTEKARKQVDFLNKRANDAKQKYQFAEYALSSYRDKNRSVFLNTAKIEEQRLQADFLLTQTVYNDLLKQLEQAKIKVQEETPVFKMLEPPQVPLKKSGPKRTVIIIGFSILGIIIGFIINLYQLWKRKSHRVIV